MIRNNVSRDLSTPIKFDDRGKDTSAKIFSILDKFQIQFT